MAALTNIEELILPVARTFLRRMVISGYALATSLFAARARFVPIFAVCAFALSGCVFPDSNSSDGSLASSWVRPNDPQEQLGAKEHPVVLAKYGGEYQNEQAERLIAVIVGKLVAVSDDPSRVYKITILNSPKVNAFALPGGFLYVTRGLLALASDSSELAAVIAHEMAHVSANHAILRREKLSSAAIGEQVVTEVLGESPAGKVALAANRIRLSQFSQEQELQADTIGIRMIGRAGFDPFAAARFLKVMDAYRNYLAGKTSGSDGSSFYSSHPSTPKRIDLAVRHARFFGAPGIGNKGKERYLEGIDGLLYGDTADEGFVRGRVFSHTGLGITFSAPPGFRIDNQPQAIMIVGPGEIATRFDATVLSPQKGLAEYAKSGWISGLIEDSIREETQNGMESVTAIAVGESWRFRVRLMRRGSQLFRFITAAPQTNTNIDTVSRQITGSLRRLTKNEIARLQPLKLKVITAKPGDTVSRLARKMSGVSNKESLLRILNGFPTGQRIQPGDKIKIVSDT